MDSQKIFPRISYFHCTAWQFLNYACFRHMAFYVRFHFIAISVFHPVVVNTRQHFSYVSRVPVP